MSLVHFRDPTNIYDIPVSGANPLPVTFGGTVPLGHQQIVGAAASTALTVPTGATYAVITVENQAVRWRDDGTAPTASVGMPIAAGQSYTFSGAAILAALRFIQQAVSATINVAYYK